MVGKWILNNIMVNVSIKVAAQMPHTYVTSHIVITYEHYFERLDIATCIIYYHLSHHVNHLYKPYYNDFLSTYFQTCKYNNFY